MNALSWFLLLIDFYGNFQLFCLTLFWLLVSGVVVRGAAGLLTHLDHYPREPEDPKSLYSKWDRRQIASAAWFDEKKWIPAWYVFAWIIFLSLVAFLSPTKDTLYLVASSEAAEMVVASEQGQEVLADLREVLDAQLEALKGPITQGD